MIGPVRAKILKLLIKSTRHRQLPLEVEARLVAPLYAQVGSVMVAHGTGIFLCVLAMVRIGGVWPEVLLLVSLGMLALRIRLLARIHGGTEPATPYALLSFRLHYQMIGLAWSAVSATTCGYCMSADRYGTLWLIAAFLALGTAAGIASRSAGTPRFAMAQIGFWLLPFAVAVPLTQADAWIVPFMASVYALALGFIVRRHYHDALKLIEAEHLRQQAQIAIEHQAKELRGIFENAAAGVTLIDLVADRLVKVNRVFCDMVGRDEAQLLGNFPPTDLTHPADRPEQSEHWAAIRATGQAFDCETRYLRVDGAIVWGHLSASVAAFGDDGKPRLVVSIIQNITQRKQAEAALRANQELLRLSLDIGGVGTFRRDYINGLIHCSRETRLICGLPTEDGPIPTEVWFMTLLPEDRSRFLKEAADAQAEHRLIVNFDFRFVHPEKGIRYGETRSQVDYDAAGRALGSVGVIIDVTDRRRAESRLAHLAHHDPLTDLPNRSLFRIRLDKALARSQFGEACAVFCIDLDRFKEVNDTLGHPVGDALLRAVTQRLQALCRPSDTVARLGGDEFAIIQSPLGQNSEATCFAEHIIAAIGAPYNIEGERIVIGSSIGSSIAPNDGLDADRLLRNADMALYTAKSAGRGCHRIFEAAMDARLQARRALDSDLRQALADDALELYYQPLIDIATHRICGFEALLRWRHPTRGFVMPDEFIPLAESIGMIVPIGAFVLGRACAQAATWPGRPRVAVNLSASEFTSPNLVETVASALSSADLDPQRLELEITESTMLQDTKITMETLGRLKALGVSISIDDFGTGFSSLAYLQRFPFDKVKIDRSFITPLGQKRESLAIVGAVINLCAGLDMQTTAEGVETESQLAILSQLGCTQAQGYYFSRPRPADEIASLIEALEAAALARQRILPARSSAAFLADPVRSRQPEHCPLPG